MAEAAIAHLETGTRSVFASSVGQALHVRSLQIARANEINMPEAVERQLACPGCAVLWVPGVTASVRITSRSNRNMRRMRKYLKKRNIRPQATPQPTNLRYSCTQCGVSVVNDLPRELVIPAPRTSATSSSAPDTSSSKKRAKMRKQSSLKQMVASSKSSKGKLSQGGLGLNDFLL